MSITLHPTKGVNPHLTICPRCGGDGDELLLLGNQDKVYTCDGCRHEGKTTNIIGQSGKCTEHPHDGKTYVRELGEHEKLPATEPCKACQKELDTFEKEVAAGGVYWRCPIGHAGVLKAGSELANQVREHMNLPAPAPCGLEFTEDDCPACHPELVG